MFIAVLWGTSDHPFTPGVILLYVSLHYLASSCHRSEEWTLHRPATAKEKQIFGARGRISEHLTRHGFSYKFGLVEMAISTNPKPTIYRNLGTPPWQVNELLVREIIHIAQDNGSTVSQRYQCWSVSSCSLRARADSLAAGRTRPKSHSCYSDGCRVHLFLQYSCTLT